MNTELAEFIKLNSINEEVLYEALHRDILESILSEVCEYMKASESAYVSIKQIYFRNCSDIDSTCQIVQNICHLTLPKQDLIWLNGCIKAFMKKKPYRKQLTPLRTGLWNAQNKRCCICGKELTEDEGHVDHVVPWDYVGDELKNNYQLLCADCNLHKSNHVARTVHALIFHKT